MRRAVAAVIVGGFACGGIGSGLGQQSGGFGASLTADARSTITGASLIAALKPVQKGNHKTSRVRAGVKNSARNASAKKAFTKVISYDGLQFNVPFGWPVYWLNHHPHQCVRYDINAVYVGTPGVNQNCPAGLIGRADTISIGPPPMSAASIEAGSPIGAGTPIAVTEGGLNTPAVSPTPARADQRAMIGGNPVTDPSVTPGTIVQDPDLHEFAVAMLASLPWIEATYGTDPALIEKALATIRQITSESVLLTKSKRLKISGKFSFTGQLKHTVWPKRPKPTPVATPWSWPPVLIPTPTPIPILTPTPTPTVTITPSPKKTPTPKITPTPTASQSTPAAPPDTPGTTLAGFDACAAPSLSTMKAWRAKYAATAIYIGGQMVACDQNNLSASWVHQTEAMGYSLMPLFVGLQAPCDSYSGKINPSRAAAQGTAAANQAISNANSYGLGAGSPIYYDMEAYDHTNASCRTAVLTFLDAWDRQLTARDYVSGVYSSADAAVIDLQTTTKIAGHPLAEPEAIWFALWDNAINLTGSPYLSSAVWPVAYRSKQFFGNHKVKVGGITLSIDGDLVHSAVVGG